MDQGKKDLVRRAGTRTYKTRQREAIKTYLEQVAIPCSASEIYEALKEQGLSLGLTTVYRNLCLMAENSEIRQVLASKGISASKFQAIADDDQMHIHLHCSDCGSCEQLDCTAMGEWKEHFLDIHRFTVDMPELVLSGICEDCKDKLGPQKGK